MVDKVIGELPGISSLDATSLFVAEQSGQAVKVSGKQLTDFSNVETTAQVEQAKASAQAAKTAQAAAEAAILKGPIIQNGTWWVYNQTAGVYQDTGTKATGPQGIPGPTSSVNGISPDNSGNITLTAGNVNAYSKTEADNLLQKKANASSVYTKSETYTKEETNTLLQKKADKDRVVNPNLLDNWYFGNPVDQRGGYVVPPGVNFFKLNTSTQAGTTSAYYSVDKFDSNGAALFTINGTQYYCNGQEAVRGYTGFVYGIDRWCTAKATDTLESGIKIISNVYNNSFYQFIEPAMWDLLAGKTVTLSYLISEISGVWNIASHNTVKGTVSQTGIASVTYTMPSNISDSFKFVGIAGQDNTSVTIQAAKLELGSQQTLAHQENGVWVLNEIPDYGEQLRRCQYYHLEGYINAWLLRARESESPKYSMTVNFPKMRVAPAVTLYDGAGNKITSTPQVAVSYPESFTAVSDVETVLFKYVLNADL